MAKETRSDGSHANEKDRDEQKVAAHKKAAAKKVTKKKSKAKAKKKSDAKKSKSSKQAAPAQAAPARAAPAEFTASMPPSGEDRPAGAMRGIVALWGPLAIIVLLIVIARVGEDSPAGRSGGKTTALPASLESAEGVAGDVVEDVRDALTGGDPRVAAALGAGADAGRRPHEDLAAAFQDAGSVPGSGGAGAPPAPAKSSVAPDPWDASSQTTVPTGMAARPEAVPPYPENPWAPVAPLPPAELQTDPYSQGYSQGAPPPPGRGYGRHQGYGAGGMYSEPDPYYPRHRGGYGPPPAYGERGRGYGRRQAYGGAPGYGPPPGYGESQGYPYPRPYYGEPAPYPQDYYPPAQ